MDLIDQPIKSKQEIRKQKCKEAMARYYEKNREKHLEQCKARQKTEKAKVQHKVRYIFRKELLPQLIE